ncbi:hypothetical protein MITS9509_02371 [Synechococcus sp. MIT S9509]|nr:hypothetical protein MITS9504_02193 [Synechococcus sp. MIT S9504]KZR91435.1 hypothetical protein MITS9509_02371 [Synechococcus sp. MIT S9509]
MAVMAQQSLANFKTEADFPDLRPMEWIVEASELQWCKQLIARRHQESKPPEQIDRQRLAVNVH